MDHAATARRLYELLSAGDVDGFGDLLADDFIEYEELPGLAPSKDGVKTFFSMQIAAFPDLRLSVEDIVDGGDKVVARVRYTGTQQGEFMGMPATGKAVDIQLIDIFELRRRRPRPRALGRPRPDDDDAAAGRGSSGRPCLTGPRRLVRRPASAELASQRPPSPGSRNRWRPVARSHSLRRNRR